MTDMIQHNMEQLTTTKTLTVKVHATRNRY